MRKCVVVITCLILSDIFYAVLTKESVELLALITPSKEVLGVNFLNTTCIASAALLQRRFI
jgi:hypothetical protein